MPKDIKLTKVLPQEELEQILPYHTIISYNDVVPDDYQQRLQQIDAAFTIGYFEMGDIANECIKYAPIVEKEKHRIITYEDVYDAVGYFCKRTARTVRYYAETSKFYPADVRQEYHELAFSVFVAAKSLHINKIADWEDVLDFAVENIHLTAEQIEAFFKARVRNREQAQGVQVDIGMVDREQITPKEGALLKVLSGLSSMVNRLARLLESAEVQPEIKGRVQGVLDEVAEIVMDIKDML